MSLKRLLRSEKLARKTAPGEIGLSFEEAVRLANEGRVIVWAPLPPPEAPPGPPASEAPLPTEAKAELQPEPPRAWHDDYCHWRARTAADDYDEAKETDEDDDPLGLYR